MQISTELIKQLREKTNAGVLECKKALEEVGGDVDRAAKTLLERGYAMAEKKGARIASEGLVETYVHPGGRMAAIVEVNCETDFVARTEQFKQLAHDLAMQVVATDPKFISPEDIPGGQSPDAEACLLLQPFIKDPQKTVQDLIAEAVGKLRENIRVRRFARFELGRCNEPAKV